LLLLRNWKIAAVQGYLLGRPMTPQAAADLVIGARPAAPE